MTSNSMTLINNFTSVLYNVIYILDDRSSYTWPIGLEKILINNAEDLYVSIRSLSTDGDLYQPTNKKLVQDLHYFFKESVRAYCSGYPDYLQFNGDLEDFNEIVLELEKIMCFDYERMKHDNEQFFFELNKCVLNPKRIERFATKFGMEFFDYLDAIHV